jgi:hypothetical protein
LRKNIFKLLESQFNNLTTPHPLGAEMRLFYH